jgi:nucleoside-diphosphate-sugar epimerase
MEMAVLRPPAVYGPRDRDLLVFFRLARRGILPVPMGAARPLQMIHVADLVRAITAAGFAEGATGLLHVAEAQAYTWGAVLELVAQAVGRVGRRIPVPRILVRMAGGVSGALGGLAGKPPIFDADKAREILAPGWLCDTEAARRALGFEASIPLEQGLAETADWYRRKGWLR